MAQEESLEERREKILKDIREGNYTLSKKNNVIIGYHLSKTDQSKYVWEESTQENTEDLIKMKVSWNCTYLSKKEVAIKLRVYRYNKFYSKADTGTLNEVLSYDPDYTGEEFFHQYNYRNGTEIFNSVKGDVPWKEEYIDSSSYSGWNIVDGFYERKYPRNADSLETWYHQGWSQQDLLKDYVRRGVLFLHIEWAGMEAYYGSALEEKIEDINFSWTFGFEYDTESSGIIDYRVKEMSSWENLTEDKQYPIQDSYWDDKVKWKSDGSGGQEIISNDNTYTCRGNIYRKTGHNLVGWRVYSYGIGMFTDIAPAYAPEGKKREIDRRLPPTPEYDSEIAKKFYDWIYEDGWGNIETTDNSVRKNFFDPWWFADSNNKPIKLDKFLQFSKRLKTNAFGASNKRGSSTEFSFVALFEPIKITISFYKDNVPLYNPEDRKCTFFYGIKGYRIPNNYSNVKPEELLGLDPEKIDENNTPWCFGGKGTEIRANGQAITFDNVYKEGYKFDGFYYKNGNNDEVCVSKKASIGGKPCLCWDVDEYFFTESNIKLVAKYTGTQDPNFRIDNTDEKSGHLDDKNRLTVPISLGTEENWVSFKYLLDSPVKIDWIGLVTKEINEKGETIWPQDKYIEYKLGGITNEKKFYILGRKLGDNHYLKIKIPEDPNGNYISRNDIPAEDPAHKSIVYRVNVVKKQPSLTLSQGRWVIPCSNNPCEETFFFTYVGDIGKLTFTTKNNDIEGNDGNDAEIISIEKVLGSTQNTYNLNKIRCIWNNPHPAGSTSTDSKEITIIASQPETENYSAFLQEIPLVLEHVGFNITYRENRSSSAKSVTDKKHTGTAYTIRTTLPEDWAIKKGYVFTGWITNDLKENDNTDKKFLIPLDSSQKIQLDEGTNKNITFYPIWEKEENTITYILNGGYGLETLVDKKNRNATYTISFEGKKTPKRLGYTFSGWTTNLYGEGTFYPYGENARHEYKKNEDLVLYAVWTNNNAAEHDKLYPPLIETYQKSNIWNENAVIEYTMPEYNDDKIKNIKYIQISVVDQLTNESVLEDRAKVLLVPWENTSFDENTYIGSVVLPVNKIVGKQFQHKLYKIQLRFDTTILEDSQFLELTDVKKLNEYLVSSRDNFSEWSSATLLKPIPPCRIITSFPSGGFGPKINSFVGGKLIFYTIDSGETINENEVDDYVESFTVDILKDGKVILAGDTDKNPKDNLLSGYRVNGLMQYFDFTKDGLPNSDCLVRWRYTTKNGYSGEQTDQIHINDYSNFNQSFINGFAVDEIEEEYGYNTLKVSINGSNLIDKNKTISFDVFKASSEDNYSTWLKVNKRSIVPKKDAGNQDYYFFDPILKSGIDYTYAVQLSSGAQKAGEVKQINNVSNNFYNATLLRGNKILKLSYNFKINNFTSKVGRSMVETIGGKYPVFTKNGTLKYKQIGITGLISFEDNLSNKFLSISDLLGEGYCKTLISKINNCTKEDHSPHYPYISLDDAAKHLDYNVVPMEDRWAIEREFREQVLAWLNDGQPKLFRSGTEGNIVVILDNVSLSAEAQLSRKLYEFSATMYEIADCNYDNLVSLGIYKEGNGNDSTLSIFTR